MSAPAARLAAGGVVILDGATGTELQRRGVPMHEVAWSATALATHPSIVREVHADYIRAGADVIVANSFAANRALLEQAGLGDRVREFNLAAARLAREARAEAAGARAVAIAGSINLWDRPAGPEAAGAVVAEQADLLAEGGVDLIALELMESVEETAAALEAARGTGLPVWVGVSVRRAPDGAPVLLRDGETLDAAVAAWLPLGPAALLVMHSLPDDVAPALDVLGARWKGPLGAYAHMGAFARPHWRWVDVLPPSDYADRAEEWVEQGASIVGACCGSGPDTIAALAERFGNAARGGAGRG